MARLIRAGDFIGRGEKLAAANLERHLPDSWTVICNKELLNPDGSTRELDLIVVGEHSIFAIDEKSWTGPIHGNENGWVLSSGESFNNPLGKVEYLARRLAGLLRRNVPLLKQELERVHFVFPRILLSADDVETYVHDPRMRQEALRLESAIEQLKKFDKQQGSIASVAKFRNPIIHELTNLPNRPKIPRMVGEYEIQELLDTYGPTRSLRAVHADGSERLLKLVRRPETADDTARHEFEQAIRREYDSLRLLYSKNVAPPVDPFLSWEEGDYLVVPIHPCPGRSLRSLRAEGAPSTSSILPTVEAAFRALETVHDAGVIHRSLTPDRVCVTEGGQVVFSDFVISRIEGQKTIAGVADELDPENFYRAPECRLGLELAVQSSDVFSLAASLFHWITGHEAQEPDAAYPRLVSLRKDIDQEAATLLDNIFSTCFLEDDQRRPLANDVAEKIRTKIQRQADIDSSSQLEDQLHEGAVVEDQYQIRRVLGSGGTADTYLALDLVADELFVLKRIRNPELHQRLSQAEFKSLKDLHHPNLPRVFDIRPAKSPFHLKLEYIAGTSLKDSWEQFRGDIPACLRIGRDVLSALEYLAEKRLIHRDVSPANLLIPDEDSGPICLIDFGLATTDVDTQSVVGTPRYRAPDVESGKNWTPQCDLYSVAVLIFELLTGRLPYAERDDRRNKSELIAPTAFEERHFGSRLLNVLMKGANPNCDDRFETAKDFREALEQSQVTEREVVEGEQIENPFVDELRQAYRNSAIGNTNNRGLESKFSRNTYVATALDTKLLPQLADGRFKVVVLSGNPGDGKTAFLQQLHKVLIQKGAETQSEDEAGWQLEVDGARFGALYDASESHGQKSADDLMHEVLAPLSGRERPDLAYTAAIAVNDGRLWSFFERYGTLRYPWLWNSLRPQLEGDKATDDSVLLVDLKRRCMVASDVGGTSLFEGILDQFISEANWQSCSACSARTECPILTNVKSLSDRQLSATVRQQLHRMLLAVHLRRERRPTIRDLRSALAFLITHDLGCRDIHDERHRERWPLADQSRMYFNAAFNGEGGEDLLLDEWAQLDPAVVATPRLDRFFHFHRTSEEHHAIDALLAQSEGRPSLPIAGSDQGDRLASLKRRYAFEADESAVVRNRFPNAEQLLPYQFFRDFVEALRSNAPSDLLRANILQGICRLDRVPDHMAGDGLALRLTEASSNDLIVVKQFPAEEFIVEVPPLPVSDVESVPDRLLLKHSDGWPSLVIGLDLFELIHRAREGFLPGSEEQRPLIEELDIFKNQLLTRPTLQVSILEAGHRHHHVHLEDGKIVRQEANQ